MRRSRFLVIATLCSALVAASCDDDPEAPSNVELTEGQAELAGLAVGDQAGNLTSAFTLDGITEAPVGKVLAMAPLPASLRLRFTHVLRAQRFILGDSCAAVSDTTDTDGDGVPDDLTVTFSAPACTTVYEDSSTATLSGSFRISDPGAEAGFNVTYTDVRFRIEDGDESILFELDGTQSVATTETSASLAENTTFVVALDSDSLDTSLAIQNNWSATFAADPGETFDVREPLPPGTIQVNGATVWTTPEVQANLAVTTVAPLVYGADCTSEPPFDSGTLRALVVGNRGGAFIRVQFIGCGKDPIVTLLGQPSS